MEPLKLRTDATGGHNCDLKVNLSIWSPIRIPNQLQYI